MSEARCFNCGKELHIDRPMEELLDAEFPVFCSIECSEQFPSTGDPKFDLRLRKLREGDSNAD